MTTNKTISTTVHGYKFAASAVHLTITSTGKVTGSSNAGDAAIYGVSTRAGEVITNLGQVNGESYLYGIVLKDGGSITNGSAAVKTATITSTGTGIRLSGAAGTVTNSGTIHGDNKAIEFDKGGVVTNGSASDTTARITTASGGYAIGINYGVGKVTNFGTIIGEVSLYEGGSITNEKSGNMNVGVVYLAGGGTITNLGVITGVIKQTSGQMINGSATDKTATIGGGNYGVYLGGGTLTNYGTITGKNDTVAVDGGTVIVESGSKMIGPAGYAQGATLVFGAGGGAGTITGIGTGTITGSTSEKFRELTKYEIQSAASWTLSGTNTVKAGDSLTVDGTLSLAASLLGTGKLSIAKTGTVKGPATGSAEIVTAIANAGLLIATGGTLKLDKAVTGAGSAGISKGTLDAAGTFTENVQFTSTTGKLELDHSLTYTGKVSGFSHTGATSLDLRDIKFVSASEAKFTGTAAGGTLTVSDGTHTSKIALLGNFTGVTFKAASDGSGGTTIVDVAKAASVPGFISTMASVGALSGGSTTLTQDSGRTAPLLAHPRA